MGKIMPKTVWILTDNRRGSVNQAKGVADALDHEQFSIIEKNIEYNRWSGLPNWIRGKSLLGTTEATRKQICAPYPDIVISVSRRTVPVARFIKTRYSQVKLVQLMHPGRTGLKDFDLIVVPEHDRNKLKSPNIHYILGCPHRVTEKYLAAGRLRWQEEFAHLPKPLTAVIIGGSIKGKPFSDDNAAALGQAVRRLKEAIGGSLLLTTSRRTGITAEKIILSAVKDIPQYTYLWGDMKENPYNGFLACADNIVITGDSVSMCCEATGTGKPIYVFCGQNWLTPKHLRFVDSICKAKCAIRIEDKNAASFHPEKSLNAAAEVADLLTKL